MSSEVIKPFSDQGGKRLGYSFWCDGCKSYHGVWTEIPNPATGAKWTFNGDLIKPTFSPSIVVKMKENSMCHSFIRDGKIEFLGDCTHEFANKTVELKNDDYGDS